MAKVHLGTQLNSSKETTIMRISLSVVKDTLLKLPAFVVKQVKNDPPPVVTTFAIVNN